MYNFREKAATMKEDTAYYTTIAGESYNFCFRKNMCTWNLFVRFISII